MLTEKLLSVTPSYTVKISSQIKNMKDNGIKILDLSIGEPDFIIPEKAKQYGIKSLNENKTKYNLVPGIQILRDEICNKLLNENKCNYISDEIVVCSGAKNAITNSLLALTNPGDEIIIPVPYWTSYPEMVKLVGAYPIMLQTHKQNRFKIDITKLEQHITNKTKALILNNPCNPTGSVYSKYELEKIVDICHKNNIYIISDEIYEKIVFDNNFISTASISDVAKEITITINGFSKSGAMTGLRLGYSASNKTISKAISTIQGHLMSHPSLTSQYIGYGLLKECRENINDMTKIYKKRMDLVCSRLDSIENIDYISPEGGFYVFIDLSNVKINYSYKKNFSLEFSNDLLMTQNVAVVPGIAFGMDDFIRISFCCDEQTINKAINKLTLFLKNINQSI